MIEEAEQYYIQISQDLGLVRFNFWLWENRAKFYIYNDADDYIKHTHQPAWSSAVVDHQKKIIKTYPQASGFFDSLMPHELGHIIFREFIGAKAQIPLWLEEGVASYQEKSKRLTADRIVRKAQVEDKFIPLKELPQINIRDTDDKELVGLFYAEAVSVVNFMISKFGRGRFSWFCRDLRDGKPFEERLWRFNCRDISALNKKWVKYLKEK